VISPRNYSGGYKVARDKKERGLKNPWAIQNGQLIHISEVILSRGKSSAPYLCPKEGCSKPMTFRRSITGKRRSHFAHNNEDHDWTTEGLLHAVAKRLIMNKMRVTLPALNADPEDASSRELEPSRWMRCSSITEEAFLLSNWRADLLAKEAAALDDEDHPFAILTEEKTGSYLIIEIIVTSSITQKKVDAYQRAGYRSISIEFDRDDIDDPNLERLILEKAHRRWLSHPRWQEARERQWQEKEEARQKEIEAERSRVASILKRIKEGQPPDWDPIDGQRLDLFMRDVGLQGYVDIKTPFDHWMAGERKWWQIDLLRSFIEDKMFHSGHRHRKAREHPSERVKGYIIPFNDNEEDETLLSEVKVPFGEFGTQTSATEFYLTFLMEQGVISGTMRRPSVIQRLADISYRHDTISHMLRPLFQGSGIGTEFSDRNIDEWKSQPHNGNTRRDAIIAGGRPFEEIRQLAFRDAARRRREIIAAGHKEHDKPGDSYYGPVISADPELPVSIALESVLERPETPRNDAGFSNAREKRNVIKVPRSTLGTYTPKTGRNRTNAKTPKPVYDSKPVEPPPPPPDYDPDLAEKIYSESTLPTVEAKSRAILHAHSNKLPEKFRLSYRSDGLSSLGGSSRMAHTKDRKTAEEAINAR